MFFLSGDIHYTHLTERERPGTYPLIELTCSPLTARVHPRPFAYFVRRSGATGRVQFVVPLLRAARVMQLP